MAAQRVAEMTVEELKTLINQVIDERIRGIRVIPHSPDSRTLDEVYKSIDDNMWTPPPGSKSSLDFLREDRDR